MPSITLYRWRAKKPNGRWETLRWMMTEEDARKWSKTNNREIAQIANSAEARHVDDERIGGLMDNIRYSGSDDE